MRIIAEEDVGGPLDGRKTIYTVALEGGKYHADVMACADSGLIYVMQQEDGRTVRDYTSKTVDYQLDEEKVVDFVRRWLSAQRHKEE